MITVGGRAVVVLDIDDTLYLERDYVHSGFEAVGRELDRSHGLAGIGEVLWAGFESGVRGDAFDRALHGTGVEPSPELVARLVACYRSHTPSIALATDAERFLARLGQRARAAITDGPAESQWAKARALGLDRLLHHVIVTAELGVGRSKPAPDAYLLVEDRFETEPGRCWYIADNPAKDFVVPLQRGWQTARIRRSGSLHHHVPTPDGVREIVSLDELVVDDDDS